MVVSERVGIKVGDGAGMVVEEDVSKVVGDGDGIGVGEDVDVIIGKSIGIMQHKTPKSAIGGGRNMGAYSFQTSKMINFWPSLIQNRVSKLSVRSIILDL